MRFQINIRWKCSLKYEGGKACSYQTFKYSNGSMMPQSSDLISVACTQIDKSSAYKQSKVTGPHQINLHFLDYIISFEDFYNYDHYNIPQ